MGAPLLPAPIPRGSRIPPARGGGSGEEQDGEDAGQQEVAGGRPGGSGGAVAQVGVTAVDADPRQLLLLAVAGGGTAAGQQDAQDHCKASTGREVRGRAGWRGCCDSLEQGTGPARGLQGWVWG